MNRTNDYQIKHIYIDGYAIMYKLFIKPTKNSYIRISKNDEIHVTVGKWMNQQLLDSFLQKHILNMHKRILIKKTTKLIDPDFTYLHLLNERYSISSMFTNKRRTYEILDKKIYLYCNKNSDKEFLVHKVLLDHWKKIIPPMFRFWENETKLFASLSVRWMTTRFGVCKIGAKKITLALQLICYSKDVINYLIVHELAHLVHGHHQKSFWIYVEKYLPNRKAIQKELNK